MTDRELLELAAKAAGIEHTGEDYARRSMGGGHYENFPWNPLLDDGDALRLGVKLNILTYQTGLDQSYASTPMNWSCTVPHNDDPYAATRLAIVRAAAEIGKRMK